MQPTPPTADLAAAQRCLLHTLRSLDRAATPGERLAAVGPLLEGRTLPVLVGHLVRELERQQTHVFRVIAPGTFEVGLADSPIPWRPSTKAQAAAAVLHDLCRHPATERSVAGLSSPTSSHAADICRRSLRNVAEQLARVDQLLGAKLLGTLRVRQVNGSGVAASVALHPLQVVTE